MERVTRKIVQYLEDMEKKAKQMSFTKNLKKEVETERINDRVSGSFTYDYQRRD